MLWIFQFRVFLIAILQEFRHDQNVYLFFMIQNIVDDRLKILWFKLHLGIILYLLDFMDNKYTRAFIPYGFVYHRISLRYSFAAAQIADIDMINKRNVFNKPYAVKAPSRGIIIAF